jgi:uncharacterized membrane protein YbaN (DUF454 family)
MQQPSRPALISNPIWALCGLAALVLAAVGAVLPLLPTTPLVLLAAFCFGKGSPRLRHWLENHAVFGEAIREWEHTGAIAPKYKRIAVGMMAATFVISLVIALPAHVLVIQALCMGGASLYVLTRPDGPKPNKED